MNTPFYDNETTARTTEKFLAYSDSYYFLINSNSEDLQGPPESFTTSESPPETGKDLQGLQAQQEEALLIEVTIPSPNSNS